MSNAAKGVSDWISNISVPSLMRKVEMLVHLIHRRLDDHACLDGFVFKISDQSCEVRPLPAYVRSHSGQGGCGSWWQGESDV